MSLIRDARADDLTSLATLFDDYRRFYELESDLELSTRYMRERLTNRDSVLLVAPAPDGEPLGFTQMYPTWCSLLAAPIYVLYDLYIAPAARRQGTARALMLAAVERARQDGRRRLDLATAKTNVQAQILYESLGWRRDEDFHSYSLEIG
jgi:ribosomal protein S18 acetylase RimI-like enzyme